MRRYLFAALLDGSLGLSACSSGTEATRDEAGAVASEGSVDAFSVQLGDCLNEPIPAGEALQEVEDVAATPCGQPHDGEVYAVFDLPDGDFPGDDAVGKAGEERCVTDFEAFIGMPYDDSALEFFTYQPTEASWETQDDREIVCVVVDPEAKTTGSLEGAAR